MSYLPSPTTSRGVSTRRKILRAAELEFGESGYHSASISSITRRAGVAQGTFYLYFPSKEDALRELVRRMGRELRRFLSSRTEGARDRLEQERLGLRAFIEFARAHPNLYKVVMEAQFVDDRIYREYYETLATSYAQGLRGAQQRGEVRQGDAEAQAWALMGIAHFLGLRYAIWREEDPSEQTMEAIYALIENGLQPRAAKTPGGDER